MRIHHPLIALVAALTLAACGTARNDATTTSAATSAAPVASAAPATTGDIVTVAVGAGSFKTLADLLTKAGLVDTLKGSGPFTVFAPTDDAFAKVDKATLDKLAANPAALRQVLTYHVVAGKVMAADVKPGTVRMVSGDPAAIAVNAGKVTINRANVVKTDVGASNGVIHVIDAVILPAGLRL
jgi:uncharacterized surface protein with fasciclin (FAS1) repeats